MLISLKTLLTNLYRQYPSVIVGLIIFGLGIILTIFFTWPMVFHLTTFFSDESDYTLIGWIMWYNQHSFLSGRIFSSVDYFNAFQFYPWPYALAFSEHMFIPSLLFAPLYWFTNQLVLSVNTYTFFTFVLTFISSFYVFKKLLKSLSAGIIAATIFTFNPITASHFPGHTHLLGKFFIPLLFLSVINFFNSPTLKNAFFLSLTFTFNALTSINLFIISIPSILFTSLPFIFVKISNKDTTYFIRLFRNSLIGLLFLPLFFHFILPYKNFSVQEKAVRGLDESIFFSAEFKDWLAPFPESLLYEAWIDYLDPLRKDFPKLNYSEHTLGLNIIPFVLFLIGLIYLNQQKTITSNTFKFSLMALLLGTSLFTFGPVYNGEKTLYYTFNELTGLLNGIRVPTRFQFFFYLPFSVIAGLGYLIAIQKLKIKKELLFIFFLSLIMLEGYNKWNFFSDTSSLTQNSPAVSQYQQLNFLQNKKTLHLPSYNPNFEKQIYYLVLSIFHSETLLNGYSGYFPPEWMQLIKQIDTSTIDLSTIKKLNALKVDFLILHKEKYPPDVIKKIESSIPQAGITYNSSEYLVLNVQHKNYQTTQCNLQTDIQITIISTSTHPIARISNPNNCYLVNILNDRYYKTSFMNQGTSQKLIFFRLPVLMEPQTTTLMKD